MNSNLFSNSQDEFKNWTGLDASENPVAYVEFVKMLAQELIYETLQEIKLELAAIKNKID
jgi:hypothetical protein